MAATVEGVFRIIDRASGPMRRIQAQAEMTDRAVERLGDRLDHVGTRDQVRKLEQTERELRTIQRTSRDAHRDTDRLSDGFRRATQSSNSFASAMRRAGINLFSFQKVLGLVKLPALAAAIGLAAIAVSNLASGILGLVPAVGDLAGVVAPLPAVFIGLATAMATVKLAFKDFGQAMSGNEQALKRVTPEARRLITTLKMYGPVMKDLRASAQGGIFGGLDFAVRRIQRGVPMANRLLRAMSRTLGDLVKQASVRLTTRSFLRDFEALGGQGRRIVGLAGGGILNIVEALRNFAVAAMPFTRWLTTTIAGWMRWAAAASRAARDSGRFADWLERTRASLTMFGHILRDVWFTLGNLLKAARPLGDRLWRGAEKATAAWRELSGTTEAQIKLTRIFLAAEEPIKQMFLLVGDLGKAIMRMGTDPALSKVLVILRQAVPYLERALLAFADIYGPPLARFLVQVAHAAELFATVTSPLLAALDLISRILSVILRVIDAVPGLKQGLAAAFSVVLLGRFIQKVGAATLALLGMRNAAAGAGAASLAQGGGGGLFGMFGGRRGRGGGLPTTGFAPQGGRPGARAGMLSGRMGLAALGAGALTVGAGSMVGGQAGRVASGFATGAMTGGMLGSFGMALGPEVGIPAMAIGAAAGGLYGAFRSWRAPPPDPSRDIGGIQARLEGMGGMNPNSRKQIIQQIRVMRQEEKRFASDASDRGRTVTGWLRQELDIRREVLKTINRSIRQQRNLQDVRRAKFIGRRLGATYDEDIAAGKTPEQAIDATRKRTVRALGMLDPKGRKELAQGVASWAQEMRRKGGPAVDREVDKLQTSILRKFRRTDRDVQMVNGQILTGSKTKWAGIRKAMVDEALAAKLGLANHFSQIREMAIGQLMSMGFSRSEAAGYVAGVKATGRAGALPGAGSEGPRGPRGPVGTQGTGIVANPFPALQPPGRDGVNLRRRMYAGDPPPGGRSAGRGGGGGGGTSTVVQVGRQLQQMGFLVGENPAFGGVAPVHVPNSYHYKGQALDVNWPDAGAEGGKLDSIFGWLKSMNPTELLWRVKGHFDHLHVAFGGPGAGSYVPAPGGTMAGGTPAPFRLRAPASGFAGVPGALSTAAGNAYAAGIEGSVNAAWGGWFGRGGTFTARKPTLIGVGDGGGMETVTVSRGGGGGGVSFTVHNMKIENHRPGDIRRQLKAEARAAMEELAAELDQMPMEREEELTR